ncbi:MAG: hypothetical protein V1875_00330 [Candidatus Altiarchaeota archaeon]
MISPVSRERITPRDGPIAPLKEDAVEDLTRMADMREAAAVDREAFRDTGMPLHELFVASRAGFLIGVKSGGKVVAEKALLFDACGGIYSMTTGVSTVLQSRGLGTLMAAESIKRARVAGSGVVYSHVSPLNGPQLNSYLNKLDFVAAAIFTDYFGEADYGLGSHRLLIRKDLKAEDGRRGQRPELSVDVRDTEALEGAFRDGFEAYQLIRCEGGPMLGFRRAEHPYAKGVSGIHMPSDSGDGIRPITTTMEFRDALKLEGEAFSPPSTIYFVKSMAFVGIAFGAFSDGALRGYGGVILDGKDGAYVHGPFTGVDDMRQADALISAAQEIAAKAGRKRLWTVIPGSWRREDGFLEKNGFRAGYVAEMLFDDSDGRIWSKELTD